MTSHGRSGALRASLVFAATLVAARADAAKNWEHPTFSDATARPLRIAVLPATADIVRGKVNDAEPMVKETAALEQAISREVAARVRALGYTVDVDTLAPSALAADRELHALVQALRDHVDEVMKNVADKPGAVSLGRYTIGEAALPLAGRTGADGFLLLDSQSIIPSKGRRALSAVLGAAFGGLPIPPTTISQLVAIEVDARTGNIATVLVGAAGGAVLKRPDDVATKLAEHAFRDYPKPGETRKVSRKRRAAAAAAAEAAGVRPAPAAGEEDEDALLAQFDELQRNAGAAPTPLPPANTGEVTGGPGANGTPTAETVPPDAGHADGASGAAQPPPTEEVAPHDEFVGSSGQPVNLLAAESASPDTVAPKQAPAAASAGAPALGTPTSPATAAPTPSSQATPAPSRAEAQASAASPEIRALFDMPRERRPEPTRQVTLQMLAGGPAIAVRNTTGEPVRVSVDMGAWIDLAPGEESRVAAAAGSHRLLVTDGSSTELARSSFIVSASALAVAEVAPR